MRVEGELVVRVRVKDSRRRAGGKSVCLSKPCVRVGVRRKHVCKGYKGLREREGVEGKGLSKQYLRVGVRAKHLYRSSSTAGVKAKFAERRRRRKRKKRCVCGWERAVLPLAAS